MPQPTHSMAHQGSRSGSGGRWITSTRLSITTIPFSSSVIFTNVLSMADTVMVIGDELRALHRTPEKLLVNESTLGLCMFLLRATSPD